MLQRSPGKALSMTSPLARQMARVRETGSLDVPEKTRFLSPTTVLDRRQEGARNGFRNYITSREGPYISDSSSRPAPRRRAKWFRNYISSRGSLPFSFSIPCGNLPRRFAIEHTLDVGALQAWAWIVIRRRTKKCCLC